MPYKYTLNRVVARHGAAAAGRLPAAGVLAGVVAVRRHRRAEAVNRRRAAGRRRRASPPCRPPAAPQAPGRARSRMAFRAPRPASTRRRPTAPCTRTASSRTSSRRCSPTTPSRSRCASCRAPPRRCRRPPPTSAASRSPAHRASSSPTTRRSRGGGAPRRRLRLRVQALLRPRWKARQPLRLHEREACRPGRAARARAGARRPFDYDSEVEGVRALDRYTSHQARRPRAALRLRLRQPRPVGAVAREVVEHYGDDIGAHPVGTGPYRLEAWRRSSRIVLERTPTYRDVACSTAPAADEPKGRRSRGAKAGAGCR